MNSRRLVGKLATAAEGPRQARIKAELAGYSGRFPQLADPCGLVEPAVAALNSFSRTLG
jgi:hypothetical protein